MGAGKGKTRRTQSGRVKPTLTSEQREELAEVLLAWAQVHPNADQPVISFPGGSGWTPMHMALSAADPDSVDGLAVSRVFAIGLMPDEHEPEPTWDDQLSAYRSDTELWTKEREEEQRRELATDAAVTEAAEQAPPVTF